MEQQKLIDQQKTEDVDLQKKNAKEQYKEAVNIHQSKKAKLTADLESKSIKVDDCLKKKLVSFIMKTSEKSLNAAFYNLILHKNSEIISQLGSLNINSIYNLKRTAIRQCLTNLKNYENTILGNGMFRLRRTAHIIKMMGKYLDQLMRSKDQKNMGSALLNLRRNNNER